MIEYFDDLKEDIKKVNKFDAMNAMNSMRHSVDQMVNWFIGLQFCILFLYFYEFWTLINGFYDFIS